jgi:hypothetical protein
MYFFQVPRGFCVDTQGAQGFESRTMKQIRLLLSPSSVAPTAPSKGRQRTILHRTAFAMVFLSLAPMACNRQAPTTDKDAATAPFSVESASASADPSASAETVVAAPPDTANEVVQTVPFGTVGWSLDNNGGVKADVRDANGQPIADNIAGTVQGPDGKVVPLEAVNGSTQYGANMPQFTADLTPINYALQMGSQLANGTFFVPAGGTTVLADAPAAAASAVAAVSAAANAATVAPTAPATAATAPANSESFNSVGPNGGVVQVIGTEPYEIVSDQQTGEVRAYLLGHDRKPLPIGTRKITLGVIADHPEIVTLEPVEGANYAAATWGIKANPTHITISVRDGRMFHAGIVGWRPQAHHVAIKVEPIMIIAKRTWQPPRRPLPRAVTIEVKVAELENRNKIIIQERTERLRQHPNERRIVRPGGVTVRVTEPNGAKVIVHEPPPRHGP